ncbi:MAG: ATP-binding protein [Desulfobaccales bacterium]
MSEPYTILVVDDEKVIREGCSLILQPEGYRVATANNGQEALELLRREPIDLVLCDLKMPVMGALEVLEEARHHHPEVPIIIITGHATVTNAVECMKKGAYDFVTKPFRVDHLTLVVKRAVEKLSLERQTRRLQEEQARNLYNLATEQSRLHTIINCMADGVLVTNRDLEVVLCNPALKNFLELSRPLPQPGPLSAYVPDPALREAIQTLLISPKEDNKYISLELSLGRAYLRALSAPFYGPDLELLGIVTVFHDITHFKELDEMKNDFVRMVSHELRAPLSAIKMQHTVILDGLAGDLTDKQRELLSRAQAKIQGLLDLINELLNVARMEAGHCQLEQVPLSLREILVELLELLKTKAENQKIKLHLALPSDLPPVQADRRGMEEIFMNLLCNAINYSPDGGEVRVAVVSRGDYLEVEVSDTGIGIDPEDLPKIFDKFYRAKHPQTRQVIGTGLGLAIVKKLVEAHRGSVQVESRPGAGTTFRVLLPTALSSQVSEHG